MTELKRVAIVGSARIPFARGGTAYADETNLSMLGTVLGGLIIGVTETLAARYLPAGFKEIVAYLLMLIVLMLRPHGLFSTLQRKKV